MKIVPALIAQNQKEFDERFNKVEKHFSLFQIDVMDGNFVTNTSMNFNFKLPRGKKFEVHLMVKDPLSWIKKNHASVDVVIIHIETVMKADISKVISYVKGKKKKVGIALNPQTESKRVFPYLDMIDMVLVMTVTPGKYGAPFLPRTLRKVRELRDKHKKITIEVDGGMNPKNIQLAKKAGATQFVVGSYFQKSEDIISALDKIKV